MPQLLTNDELLDVPLGNLVPGELARSFTVHAAHEQKVELAAALHVTERLETRADEAKREEDEELHERETVVLAAITEREEKLRAEAEQLDERAIKLHDGRRAYVDGDKYRDAEGRELTGADRAQAEVLHLEHSDATTWQEEQKFMKTWEETEKTRRSLEAAEAGMPGTSRAGAVSAAEKMLAQSKAITAAPDYGTGDPAIPSPALRL